MSDRLLSLNTKPKQCLKRLFRSRFSRRLSACLLAFLILVPTILFLLRPPKASALWFDDNYAYRQKFTFTHNADITSPQRISFILNTQNLVSNGVMQSDCDDTRFTDLNGKVLRFKLTGTCNAGSTTYDVVFPTVINGTNVGYVYYGNPRALNASQDVGDIAALTPNGGNPSVLTRLNEEQAPSPALFLMLDEGYGATTHDASQNQNDGGVRGATWKTKEYCVVGNCLQFNGVSDTVIATNAATIDFDTGLATASAFEAWIRPNSTGENSVGQIFNKGTNTYMRLTNAANGRADLEASFDLTTDATVPVTQGIELNRWTHVAMTQNGTTIKVYINGVLKGTSANGAGSKPADTSDLLIGGPNQAHYKGFIDEFKIYPYERTQDQINTDAAGHISSIHGQSAAFGQDDSYLSDGLVGYWKMDDGVGNPCSAGVDKACDASGNGNTGTWTNGTASTSGKFNWATNYDGVNDYIYLANGSTTGLDSQNFTIAAWFKATSEGAGTARSIANIGTGGQIIEFYLDSTSGALGIYMPDLSATGFTTANGYKDGTWHQGIVTKNGTDVKLYVDGVLGATTTMPGTINYTSTQLDIGWDEFGSDYFKGNLDEIRYYNRPLSPSEVSRLYDWGPGPVSWWKLDERTGTQAFDSSGNANTGTLIDGPTWASGKFGQALQFDGVNDRVHVPEQKSLTYTGGNMTLAGWFYSNPEEGSTGAYLFSKPFNDSGEYNYMLEYNRLNACAGVDQLKFIIMLTNGSGCGQFTLAVDGVSKGMWHHVVVTLAADKTVNIYVDGVLKASGTHSINTWTPVFADQNHSLVFGSVYDYGVGAGDLSDSTLNGFLDDMRIYNYALTPKQVVSVMNGGHPAVGSPVGSALGHWKFDEGYGTTANNSGSNDTSLNGTLSGTGLPLWKNEGKFGKALYLNGSSAYVDMGNPSAAQITSDLSLSSWVYLSSNTANQDIISKRGLSGQWGYRLWVDSTGTPKIDVSSTGNGMATASASQTLSKNQWHHLLGTYSGSQSAITIYVDGLQKGQTTSGVPLSLQNSTANLNIGREAGAVTSNYLNGSLDEVKLYNYALSSDEVKVEYNQGKTMVLGSLATDPDGTTASNSAARAYCPPGDTDTCNPPVGHWTLDERTGTTANDISGNGNTGTITNGPQWVNGKVGQALEFDGRGKRYVNLGNSTSLHLDQSKSITVEAWVYLNSFQDTFGGGRIVHYDDCDGSDGDEACTRSIYVLYQYSTGNGGHHFAFEFGNSADAGYMGLTDPAVPNLKQWYHVVGVRDVSADKVYLYVNDILVASGTDTTSGTWETTGQYAMIGSYENSSINPACECIDGRVDDVRIYNYARTPAQIAWDYNRGGPVGWWKFDECTGTTAYDASGQGNNGTITIGATTPQTTPGNCVTSDSAAAWYNGKDGKYNSSLNFDGVDDSAQIADNTALRLPNSRTLSAWINLNSLPSAGNYYGIVGKESGGAGGENYLFLVDNGVFGSGIGFDDIFNTTPSGIANIARSTNINIQTGRWYHLVGIYNSATLVQTLYVDASVAATNTNSTGEPPDSNAVGFLSIGQDPCCAGTDDWFDGQIDDVRLYNYPLNQTQIKTLYNENSAIRFGPLTGSP